MISKLIGATFGAVSILTLASVAHAQADVAKEVSTAGQHAGLASKAGDLRTVHMHLQHVVNCLVGPNGDGFDPAPGNPCRDQGNGAIPDTSDAAQKQKLTEALEVARSGVREGDIAAAKRNADDAQRILGPTM
jgi:hypothetical protein